MLISKKVFVISGEYLAVLWGVREVILREPAEKLHFISFHFQMFKKGDPSLITGYPGALYLR